MVFCEGSLFLSRLQTELSKRGVTTTAEAFEWSGTNTLAARAEAGRELASHLTTLDHGVVLIAHSHGGNSALTALRDKAVPPTMLVTMATPFIKLQKIGRADILESFAAWVGCILAPLLVVYMIWKVGVALNLVFPGTWLDLTIAITGFASIPAAILALLVFPRRARKAVKFALRNTVCYLPTRHSMLTLRGFDDEAALAIAFGGATSFLAQLIDRNLKWLMYFLLMSVGIWVGLAKLALDEQWEDWGANLLFTAWWIGLFALMVTPLAYRATRAFFGHEFLWLGTNLAVVLHSAPDHAGNAELV